MLRLLVFRHFKANWLVCRRWVWGFRGGGLRKRLATGCSGGFRGIGGFFVADIENRSTFGQFHATVGEVGNDYSAGDLRGEDGEWNHVLLALDEGLGNTVVRVRAGNSSGNLRDDEGRHVELGVFFAVFHPIACILLGGGDACVGDEVAMHSVGVVGVEDHFGEVGAVVEEEIEVADVFAVVEDGYEAAVLLRCCVYLEAVDGAIERRADELGPFAFRCAAGLGIVGGEIFKMLFAVGVADFGDLLFSDAGGDLADVVDGVEIGNERDGDPVEMVDLVIAADDDAVFPVVAGPEEDRRLGADVVEINGGMPGRIDRAEGAVGFFHEESDRGMGPGGCDGEDAESGEGDADGEPAGVHDGFDANWWDYVLGNF